MKRNQKKRLAVVRGTGVYEGSCYLVMTDGEKPDMENWQDKYIDECGGDVATNPLHIMPNEIMSHSLGVKIKPGEWCWLIVNGECPK